jgi:metal-responsive CopG/Arc/MetJ family transcriptional regulator
MRKKGKKVIPVSVALPPQIVELIDRVAEERNLSRSKVIVLAIEYFLNGGPVAQLSSSNGNSVYSPANTERTTGSSPKIVQKKTTFNSGLNPEDFWGE